MKVVHLPDVAIGEDVADWIARGGTRDELIAIGDAVPWMKKSDVCGGPVLICFADVEPRKVNWLWENRIPRGRMTLVVGMPGSGKSFATTDWAARISTGTPWPDGSPCQKGSVIFITAEDDPGDTIRPRLDAHHADVRRVHLLAMVRRFDEHGKPHDIMFSLDNLPAIEEAIEQHPDCGAIIIDPIGSFVGNKVDAHRDNEVRGVLAPLLKLAEKYGCAVIVVAHRRKSRGDTADDLALGSRAFTAMARVVWHLTTDRDNDSRRLMLPGKNNLAAKGYGLAFTIGGDPACISWERDPVKMNADEALADEYIDQRGRPPEEREEAEAWLRTELADMQEHPVAGLRKAAQDAGMSWRTVQRASRKLGVIVHRATFGGGYVWRLPKDESATSEHACHDPFNSGILSSGTQGDAH